MIELFDANNVFRRQLEQFGNEKTRERETYEGCRPNHIYVWDGHNHNARRREVFAGYKIRPPVGEDIYAWLNLMRELVYYSPAIQIEVPEWEADDVIGVLARHYIAKGVEVKIHSNDLDYFQIEGAIMDGINNKTGAPRKYIPLYKALVGDDSDKIKGIKNFGGGAFMNNEAIWDDLIQALTCNGMHWLRDNLICTKGVKAWLTDPENLALIQAYWKIVHLWDMPLDLIEQHTHAGLNDRAKAEALLNRYML